MLLGDPARTIQIGVQPKLTVPAVEIRLRKTRTDMQTARATFGSISRIDRGDFNACGSRLVLRESAKLRERPAVQVSGHKPLRSSSDTRQIFQDDSLIVRSGMSNDALADAVIRICHEPKFTARETLESSFSSLAPVGLKFAPCLLKASLLVANKLRRVESVVGGHGDPLHSEVNAQATGWFRDFGRIRVDGDVQVKLTIAEYQVCTPDLPSAQLLAHGGRGLNLSRHSTLWANRQCRFVKISLESQSASIVAHARKRFELVLLTALAGELFGNFRNRVNDVLRWQVGLFTDLIVRRVVQVIATMQLLCEAYFSNQIARLRELAHRRFQFVCGVWSNYQLALDNVLKFLHALIIPQASVCATLNYSFNGGSSPLINQGVSAAV